MHELENLKIIGILIKINILQEIIEFDPDRQNTTFQNSVEQS